MNNETKIKSKTENTITFETKYPDRHKSVCWSAYVQTLLSRNDKHHETNVSPVLVLAVLRNCLSGC